MPPLHYLSIGIFVVVYALIALRNFRRFKIPLWTIMLAGAVAMIISGALPLQDAYAAINLDVIFFLLGMFSIVAAMDLSGLLEYLTARMVRLSRTPQRALALVLFGMGLLSAFLVNDTLALTATPIMLGLSKQIRIKPSVLLITLALGVTIGSVMTPVGNPQNLLIALSSGIPNPMLDFLYYLAPPTIIGLVITLLILRFYYRKDLAKSAEDFGTIPLPPIRDGRLARLSAYVTGIVVAGFFLVGVAQLFGVQGNINLGTVSLLGATIVYLLSSRRREILASVDWGIIIFFMSLFIVVHLQPVAEQRAVRRGLHQGDAGRRVHRQQCQGVGCLGRCEHSGRRTESAGSSKQRHHSGSGREQGLRFQLTRILQDWAASDYPEHSDSLRVSSNPVTVYRLPIPTNTS